MTDDDAPSIGDTWRQLLPAPAPSWTLNTVNPVPPTGYRG